AHSINAKLGNVGKTVTFIDSVEANSSNQVKSIKQLTADMDSGVVNVLVIVGGNPVYNAPADLDFQAKLKKFSATPCKLAAHPGFYEDETSFYCQWHVPMTHELEAWSDARAFDGTATIMQPLIAPLYQGRSAIELLAILLGQRDRTGYEIVRDYWRSAMN